MVVGSKKCSKRWANHGMSVIQFTVTATASLWNVTSQLSLRSTRAMCDMWREYEQGAVS